MVKPAIKEREENLTLPNTDEKVEGGVEVKGVYATEYFRKTGTPYCEKCGEQYHTNTQDEPVCPENFTKKDCPRLGI